jgi:hypothetical protein
VVERVAGLVGEVLVERSERHGPNPRPGVTMAR